jgi:methylmalonyl-CoA mutase
MADNKLFTEFPPVLTKQWEELIQADLKGADYDKKLVWKTMEGFSVNPYYRAEDLEPLGFLPSETNQFPYLRGTKDTGNSWDIRQDIWVDDPALSNHKALQILNSGISSLRFCFSEDARKKYINEAAFNILFEDIDLSCISLNFSVGDRAKDVLSLIKEYCIKNKIPKDKIQGSIDFDILGNLTSTGAYYQTESHDFAALVVAIQKARKHFPGIRILPVDGSIFRNAGSTLVQELAFSLAMASDYLALLIEKGLSNEDVLQSLHFTFATGPVYFMEIAKLRAARLLLSRLVEVWGADKETDARMQIHSVTCDWNKTIYDPYVNLLRATSEAMSAVLGGTQSLTVNAFDSCYKVPDDFSERIARNVQLILKEEAYFDKVADPASGSYYIENLVHSLAQAAWDLFRKIESQGGYFAALKKGFIQEQVETTVNLRFSNISTRRETLLGTNQYPNFNEQIKGAVHEELVFPKAGDHSEIKPLHKARGAEQFERMRLRTENSQFRPRVFMFTIGSLAMRIARANFSCNFFASAGFEVIDNIGFKTVPEGVKAATAAKADIVVICSSDEEYASIVPEIYEELFQFKLPGGRSPITVVAGAPSCMDELRAKGISHFIHVRSNVLATLEQFQQELGL